MIIQGVKQTIGLIIWLSPWVGLIYVIVFFTINRKKRIVKLENEVNQLKNNLIELEKKIKN